MGAIPEPTTELWLWLRTYLDENIWPSTDEAVVLQMANDWGSAAEAMTDMIAEAGAANNALPGVWPDSVGTIYHRNVNSTLDDYQTMVQAYRDMELLCRNFAGQVAALRNSIIAELIVNAALFAALALFPGAAVLMGRFASQLALRLMGYSRAAVAAMEAPATVVPAALKFAGGLVGEGVEEMGISLLGDTLSIAGGYQQNYNFGQMWRSGAAGVLGGAAAPLLRPLGGLASSPAGRLTDRLGAPPGLTRTVEQASSAFVVNGISSPWAGTTVNAVADGRLPTWSEYGNAIVNQGPLAGTLASSRVVSVNAGIATGNMLRGDGFTLPNPQLVGAGQAGSPVPIGNGAGPGAPGSPTPGTPQGDSGNNSLTRGPGQPQAGTPSQPGGVGSDSPSKPSQGLGPGQSSGANSSNSPNQPGAGHQTAPGEQAANNAEQPTGVQQPGGQNSSVEQQQANQPQDTEQQPAGQPQDTEQQSAGQQPGAEQGPVQHTDGSPGQQTSLGDNGLDTSDGTNASESGARPPLGGAGAGAASGPAHAPSSSAVDPAATHTPSTTPAATSASPQGATAAPPGAPVHGQPAGPAQAPTASAQAPTAPAPAGPQNPAGTQSPAGPQNPAGTQSPAGPQNPAGTQNPGGTSPGSGRGGRVDSEGNTVDQGLEDPSVEGPSVEGPVAGQPAESLPVSETDTDTVQEGAPTDTGNTPVPAVAGALAARAAAAAAAAAPSTTTQTPPTKTPLHTNSTRPSNPTTPGGPVTPRTPGGSVTPGGPVGPPGQGAGQQRGRGNPWFDSSVPFGPADTDPAGALDAPVMQSFGRNEARWAVGEDGRVRRVTARLREDHLDGNRGDSGRHQRRAVTRAHGIEGDSGGHYVAHRFFRNNELHNLFPQNEQFNNVAYGNLEKEWAAWIAEGYEVEIEIIPSPGKARPDSITVTYTVLDTSTGQEQTVWFSGRMFVNATGQSYHGFLAALELRALEEAGTTRLGVNEVTRTAGENGVVDSVTAVLRATDPRLSDDKQAVGRAFAIQRGVPFDADGNVLGHQLFGPGGVAHLLPPGVILDPAGYTKLEQEWIVHLAAGNEVTITARRLPVAGQAVDSVHLSITATPRSGPSSPETPTPPSGPAPDGPAPQGPVPDGPALQGRVQDGPGPVVLGAGAVGDPGGANRAAWTTRAPGEPHELVLDVAEVRPESSPSRPFGWAFPTHAMDALLPEGVPVDDAPTGTVSPTPPGHTASAPESSPPAPKSSAVSATPEAPVTEPESAAARSPYRKDRLVPGWLLVSAQSSKLLQELGLLLDNGANPGHRSDNPGRLLVDLASVQHEGSDVYLVKTTTGETFRLSKRVGPLEPGVQLEYSIQPGGVPVVELRLSDRLTQDEVAPLLARVLTESAAIVRGEVDGAQVFRPDGTPEVDAVQRPADAGDRAELRQLGLVEEQLSTVDQVRRASVRAEIHKLALAMGAMNGQPNSELLRSLLTQDERAILDRVKDRGASLSDDRVSRQGYLTKAVVGTGWSAVVLGAAAAVFTGNPLVGVGIAVPTIVNALVGSLSERYLDAQKQPGKKPAYDADRAQREFDYPGVKGMLDGPAPVRPEQVKVPRATKWSNYLIRYTTPTLATAAVAGALTLFGVPALSTALVIASSALAKSLAERLVDMKKLEFRLRRVDATERIRLSDPALFANQLITEITELRTRLDRILAALEPRRGQLPAVPEAAQPPAGVTPANPTVPGAPPFKITLAVQLIENVSAAARRVFVGGDQTVDVDPTELARHVSAELEGLLNAVGPGLFGSVTGAMGDKYFINREEAANDSRKQWSRTEQEARQVAALAEILAPRLITFRQLAEHLERFTGAAPDLAARAADRGLPVPTARPGGPRPSGQSHWRAYAIQVAAASIGGAASAYGLDLIFDLPDLGVVLTVAGAAGALVGAPVSRYLFRRSEIDLQARLETILAGQAVDRSKLLEHRAVTGYLSEQLAARAEQIAELTGQRPVGRAPTENDPRYTDHVRAAVRRAELDNVPPGRPETSYNLDARVERVEALQRIDYLAAELDRLEALGVEGTMLTDARASLRFAIGLYEAIADSNGVRKAFPGLDTVNPVVGRRVVGGLTGQARFGAEQAVRRLVAEPAGKPLLLERLKVLAQLTEAADAVDHQALHGTDESRALVQERFDQALEEAARLWREAGVPNGLVLPAVSVSAGLNRVGGQVVIPLRSVPPVLPIESDQGGRHHRPESAGQGLLEWNHAQVNGARSLFGPETALDRAALGTVEQGLASLVGRGYQVEVTVDRVARPGPDADPHRFTVRVTDPTVPGPSGTEIHGPATLAELVSSLGFDSTPGRHRTEESTGRHHAAESTGRHHADGSVQGRTGAQKEYQGRHRAGEPAQPYADRSRLDDRSDLPGGRHRAPELASDSATVRPAAVVSDQPSVAQPTQAADPARAAVEQAAARAVTESVAEWLPGAIPLQDGGYRATQANGRDVVLDPATLDEVRAEARRVLDEGNDQQAARVAASRRLGELVSPRAAASESTTKPVADNPLDVSASRRAAQRIADRAARLTPSPNAPNSPNPPATPGTDTGSGRTVHAREIPDTRFVADGRPPGSRDDSVDTAAHAAKDASEADFGGLIQGSPGVVAPGLVVVQTANGPQYFKVSRKDVAPGRVAATRVRSGSLTNPHLVRMPSSLADNQLTRAWVHEISHTLQELASPRTRLRQLLRRPSAHTEDTCVAAQFSEFRLLNRQLSEARTDEEIGKLRQDLEGLVEAIRPRHQPPVLPWIAAPLQASQAAPVDGFVADVTDQVHDLQRQLDELDRRIAAKQEAAGKAAESAREAEQTAAEALRTADSGRFARAHLAGKDAAKHAEVRQWHEQVAAAYQQARQQLETVAEGYRSLLADARSMTPEQRAETASDLVNGLAAYEKLLAEVAPPLIALSSLLPTDWLPHLSALTDRVNAVLAANRVDQRFTTGALQHRLNAEFGQAVTGDGAVLRVGHARPMELRFRLSVSELVETLDPSVRASQTMAGLIGQPSRKFGITQNGRIGTSGSFGLGTLTQLFGEGSVLNAIGQLITVKGERSSGRGRSVTSTGAQYAQDGSVEDNRSESLLYAGRASWQLDARRPGDQDWSVAALAVDRGQGKDVSRLRAWMSHAYTVLAPTTTFTNGKQPSGRLPNHVLASLDGLQSLSDQVMSEFADHLNGRGDDASLLRAQIQAAITQDLPSRLAQSTEQAVLQPLQANGRPVGHLQIKTEVRYEEVELVGRPTTAHWQEGVRVGFSNASGQQTFSASTAASATVGYGGQELTDLGDTSVDLGPTASGGRSLNRSESMSGGGVGIHVGVQRYTGPTQGYRMVFEHKVTLVLDGESQGSVTGRTEGLTRLRTSDAYRHGLPVAESAFVHDNDGSRLLDNGEPVLRGDPRTGVDVPGRRLELSNWFAGGTSRVSGAGPGLAQRVTGGEQALADLVGPLAERGFLPPLDDQGDPDLARMTNDPQLARAQLLNLMELREQLSVNRLEAGYDIAVQNGIVVTLTTPAVGRAAQTLSLRIDLHPGPPSAVGVTNDEAMVTLNIGSDTAGRTDGWSKSLPWKASPLGYSQAGPEGATAKSGVSYGRQSLGRVMGWFTGGTLNQVTLVESRSPVAAFEVPHRLEVVELGSEDVVLHRGAPGTSARILVDTDLLPSTEVAPAEVISGPVSDKVLDRATLVALDTHDLNRVLQEIAGHDPTARHHLAAFLDPRNLLAHPEWARGTYRTDVLVRGAGPISTRGHLALHGRIGDVVLLGMTDAVAGDINLALTSHGLSAGQSTGGQTSVNLGANGAGQGGTASAESGTTTSTSRTDQTIAGVERLTIEVGRHYLLTGTADLTVTADGKPAPTDATVVFQIAERDALQFHVEGELTLPLAQVADVVERYLNGSLELDRRLATGIIRQYRTALAAAAAAGQPIPALSAAHTPRVLLEKLQPQHGKPTPRSKEAQLELVLDRAERVDALSKVDLPEHYRDNLGSSLVEQASLSDQGQEVSLIDRVRALMTEQLGLTPESDPVLAEALAADLAGKRWWGRLEDMLGRRGFTRDYPVGQPGQLGARQIRLTIRARFADEVVSLGVTKKTISIVQRYLYAERIRGVMRGRSLGAGLDGGVQEGQSDSLGTDRTGSSATAVGEQTTRLERMATFEGQHRLRRGVKFTIEVAPAATATPPRTWVGRALTRTESSPAPLPSATIDGKLVQLVPLRMLPELPSGGPASTTAPATTQPATTQPDASRPTGSLNERGVPDAYFVEGATSEQLSDAILERLAELLGQSGMRVHEAELDVMLSAVTLNASFSRMAQDEGFAVLRLPLPGYTSRAVEVKVGATVVGARLVGGPVDEVEIGEVNRSQHTVTQTLVSGRVLPVDGGTKLEDSGSEVSGGLTAGDQLADQTTDGRGVRRERSRFEKGRVVTVRVEVDYDVTLVEQQLRRSGEIRSGNETTLEETPRGVAYLTMFESDYQQLEQFLTPATTPGPDVAPGPEVAPDLEAWLRGERDPGDQSGPTVHAPAVEGTRFILGVRPAGQLTVQAAAAAVAGTTAVDFGGLVQGDPRITDDNLVVVHSTRHEDPQYFQVEPAGVPQGRVAATTLRAGTPDDPHLVRIDPTLAADQLPRAWVHEISHALQEHGAARVGHLLNEPAEHTEDACVIAQLNEVLLLERQWAESVEAVQHGDPDAGRATEALETDLTGLANAIEDHGHPRPVLPWENSAPAADQTAPEVFLHQLREAAQAAALTNGSSPRHEVQQYVLQQVVARVFGTSPDAWMLTGGQALLARFDGARVSTDLDLVRLDGVDRATAVADHQRALAQDLGDFLTFTLDPGATTDLDHGVRREYVVRLGDRPLIRLGVNLITAAVRMPGRPPDLIAFPNQVLPSSDDRPEVRVPSPAEMLVHKILSISPREDGTLPARPQDLVDLLLLALRSDWDGAQLHTAVREEVAHRLGGGESIVLPERFGVPDPTWFQDFGRYLAVTPGLAFGNLGDALPLARAFLDPLLAAEAPQGTWDAATKRWTTDAGEPAPVSPVQESAVVPGTRLQATGVSEPSDKVASDRMMRHWDGLVAGPASLEAQVEALKARTDLSVEEKLAVVREELLAAAGYRPSEVRSLDTKNLRFYTTQSGEIYSHSVALVADPGTTIELAYLSEHLVPALRNEAYQAYLASVGTRPEGIGRQQADAVALWRFLRSRAVVNGNEQALVDDLIDLQVQPLRDALKMRNLLIQDYGIAPERIRLAYADGDPNYGTTRWMRAQLHTLARLRTDPDRTRQALVDAIRGPEGVRASRAARVGAVVDRLLTANEPDGTAPYTLLWVRNSLGQFKDFAFGPVRDTRPEFLRQTIELLRARQPGRRLVLVGDDIFAGRPELLAAWAAEGVLDGVDTSTLVRFWEARQQADGVPLSLAEQALFYYRLHSERNAVQVGVFSGALETAALLGMPTVYLEPREHDGNRGRRLQLYWDNWLYGRDRVVRDESGAVVFGHDGRAVRTFQTSSDPLPPPMTTVQRVLFGTGRWSDTGTGVGATAFEYAMLSLVPSRIEALLRTGEIATWAQRLGNSPSDSDGGRAWGPDDWQTSRYYAEQVARWLSSEATTPEEVGTKWNAVRLALLGVLDPGFGIDPLSDGTSTTHPYALLRSQHALEVDVQARLAEAFATSGPARGAAVTDVLRDLLGDPAIRRQILAELSVFRLEPAEVDQIGTVLDQVLTAGQADRVDPVVAEHQVLTAFQAELRDRVRAQAVRRGTAMDHEYLQFALQRALARIFLHSPDGWMLKGGQTLLARLDGARSSSDIDLVDLTESSPEQMVERYQAALATDLGDHLRFEPVPGGRSRLLDGAGVRLTHRAFIGDQLVGVVSVDLLPPNGRPMWSLPESVPFPAHVMPTPTIGESPVLQVISLKDTLAHKVAGIFVHGYRTELNRCADCVIGQLGQPVCRSGDLPYRVQDLVDLTLLVSRLSWDAADVQAMLREEFENRRTQREPLVVPGRFVLPNPSWHDGFATHAANTPGLGLSTLEEALPIVDAFLTPLLSNQPATGTWDPDTKQWTGSQSPAPAVEGTRPQRILVVAHASGRSTGLGGLPVASAELTTALSELGNTEVTLLTVEGDTAHGSATIVRPDAGQGSARVRLLELARFGWPDQVPGLPPIQSDSFDVVIGHARFSGPAAMYVRERWYPQARLVHVLHMPAQRYAEVQGDPQRGAEYTEHEAEVIRAADLVVGVGPLLTDLGQDLASSGPLPGFHELIPGITVMGDAAGPRPDPAVRLNLLFTGRVGDPVKGYDDLLAVVRDLHGRGVPVSLRVRGVQPEEVEWRQAEADELLGSPDVVRVEGYSTSQADLLNDFRWAHAMVMPSRIEGFGLVAAEAAAHGLPVLVNEESGVARFLTGTERIPAVLGQAAVVGDRGLADDQDARVALWTEAIENLRAGYESRQAAAEQLRDLLRSYTWSDAARALSEAVRETARGTVSVQAAGGRRQLGGGSQVHAPEVQGTRFVADPSAADGGRTEEEALDALAGVDLADFGGLVGELAVVSDQMLVKVESSLHEEAQHFRVESRSPGRGWVAATTLRTGTAEDPHVVWIDPALPIGQLSRAWVHELSHALQEHGGGPARPGRSLTDRSVQGEDACVAAQLNEFRLLVRQWSEAMVASGNDHPAEVERLREDLIGLADAIEARGHPRPTLPWEEVPRPAGHGVRMSDPWAWFQSPQQLLTNRVTDLEDDDEDDEDELRQNGARLQASVAELDSQGAGWSGQ